MHSTLALTALLSISASAAPWSGHQDGGWRGWMGQHHGHGYGSGNSGSKGPQVPFKFPLSNGFPNIKVPSANLTVIEKAAHGTLPNSALPSKINDTTAATFQLIAFNEIFEVAFFTSLLQNITKEHSHEHEKRNWNVGAGAAKAIVLNALEAVQAQEQLHALGANAILSSAGRTPIQPCEYVFPTTSFDDAIALAATFTDVVLGTLQDALLNFANDGDVGVIPLVGGVVGQEGEQNGFYRTIGAKIPSALPFLTRSAGPFAFSALNQLFVVPGSCPNANIIPLPTFEPLTVVTPPTAPKDTTVNFSIKTTNSTSGYSLVYINQQNLPVVEKLTNVKVSGDTVTFSAPFPGKKNLMNGLTIAAVTDSAGPFADADAVAAATKFGPGLIEIN